MHFTRAISPLPFLAFSSLAGCWSIPSPIGTDRFSLDGCWYGEDFQPALGDRAGWLMNRKTDGTFAIEFLTVGPVPRTAIQTEGGRWTYSEGKYTTITTFIDGLPVDPPYIDQYDVKSINEGEMTYYHTAMNMTFASRRVACDFKVP